jgi:hypothetical protein
MKELAIIDSEEIYNACSKTLEKIAKKQGMFVTESEDTITISWKAKQNRKIDIYLKSRGIFVYECSTLQSGTLKQAKRNFCAKHALDSSQVKVEYSKK